MIFKTYFAVFFFIAIFFSFSQSGTKVPSWVKLEEIDKKEIINENETKDGYYYVIVDEQYNTLQKQDYFHYATKIVTETGLDYASQIEINYDPSFQSAKVLYIKIHRGKQIIEKSVSSEVKTLTEEKRRGQGILNGYKTLYANLSGVKKGDIVEYAYTINGYNKIFNGKINFDFWVSYSVPVGKVIYRVLFPKSDTLFIKKLYTDIGPIKVENYYNDYTWKIENPKILKVEDNTPVWYDPYPTVQMSNVNSWTQVKTWFSHLFKVSPTNDAILKSTVETIIKNEKNKINQVTKLVEFVQNSIRYSGNENGIYSHVPHEPSSVLKNAFGDCKDKSLLLCEMLKKIDVQAYPVLLNTSLKKKVKEHLPSLNKFDHCIIAISWENKLYFIDPTVSLQKGNFKERTATNYELGLVIDNSDDTFKTIPPNSTGKIKVIEEFDVSDSDARLKVELKYYGSTANQVRYYFASNSIIDIQEDYKNYYLKYADEIEIIDSIAIVDDSVNNIFTTYENYLLKNFWIPDSTSDKNVVAKDFMPYSLNEKLVYVDAINRKDPLAINFPVIISQVIKIKKESGWNIENKKFSEDNIFYHFLMSNRVEGNTLILEYDYEAKKETVEVREYKLYREKMEILNNTLVFSVSQSLVKDEEKSNFNWLLLAVIIVSLAGSIVVGIRYYNKQYHTIYERRFDSISGWLVLLAFGLVLTPISFFIELIIQFKDDFSLNHYSMFFNTESITYAPFTGYYLVFANSGNIFLLVSSIFLLLLFFQRKPSFRVYFVWIRIFNLVFLIIDTIVLYFMYKDSTNYSDQNLIHEQILEVVKMFVQSAIWAPYVWYSERSRHTFTSLEKPIVL